MIDKDDTPNDESKTTQDENTETEGKVYVFDGPESEARLKADIEYFEKLYGVKQVFL